MKSDCDASVYWYGVPLLNRNRETLQEIVSWTRFPCLQPDSSTQIPYQGHRLGAQHHFTLTPSHTTAALSHAVSNARAYLTNMTDLCSSTSLFSHHISFHMRCVRTESEQMTTVVLPNLAGRYLSVAIVTWEVKTMTNSSLCELANFKEYNESYDGFFQ